MSRGDLGKFPHRRRYCAGVATECPAWVCGGVSDVSPSASCRRCSSGFFSRQTALQGQFL